MILDNNFYEHNTKAAAHDLLGKVIFCRGKELIITETEAYLGPEDLASHARFGPTKRSSIMWRAGGHLYVYLIYGMHIMTNIVAGPENSPGAVLIRAGVNPQTGMIVTGPGRVSKFLGITRQDNGVDFSVSTSLYIEDRGLAPTQIVVSPRIGVDYAGEWAKKELRFYSK